MCGSYELVIRGGIGLAPMLPFFSGMLENGVAVSR